VTATTRKPRGDERDTVDYYFFTNEQFLAEKEAGNILESTYIENRDTHYGTYAPDFLGKIDAGYIVIMNPDIIGARYYKEQYNATTIFILPGAMDELEGRLRRRNPEMSDNDIAIRLTNARHEVEHEQAFYDYVVTNENGKLTEAVDQVVDIMNKEGYNLE
jgi:guanylate kinase